MVTLQQQVSNLGALSGLDSSLFKDKHLKLLQIPKVKYEYYYND